MEIAMPVCYCSQTKYNYCFPQLLRMCMALSTRCSVLSTLYFVLCTEYSVPSSQYVVASTQYSVLSTWYSVQLFRKCRVLTVDNKR